MGALMATAFEVSHAGGFVTVIDLSDIISPRGQSPLPEEVGRLVSFMGQATRTKVQ